MDGAKFEAFRNAAARILQVVDGAVLIELADGGAHAEILSVWSERERGSGHAGAAMRALCLLADVRGVALKLVPHALAYDIGAMESAGEADAEIDRRAELNGSRLSNAALEAWYVRLGFSRTGDTEGDDPVLLRRPRPAVLYHSAPRDAREAIVSVGLLLAASEAATLARGAGDCGWEGAGAVFLSSKAEENEAVDVWAVDASGLGVLPDDTTDCPDPDDSWWMVREDVPAERLRLHAPAAGSAPSP